MTNSILIRLARSTDLAAIVAIERVSFAPERQDSRRSLRHSLQAASQSVWVAEYWANGDAQVVATSVVHHRLHSLRIYSIAVLPAFCGRGIGRQLLERVAQHGRDTGRLTLTLESDLANHALMAWYEKIGFRRIATLDNYYAPGEHGVRMRRLLANNRSEMAQPQASYAHADA